MSKELLDRALLRLRSKLDEDEVIDAVFLEAMAERSLRRLKVAAWRSERRAADLTDADFLFRIDGIEHDAAVFLLRGRPVQVKLGRGTVFVRIAHEHDDDAAPILADIERCFPRMQALDTGVVPVTFWTAASYGADETARHLEVSPWQETRENYSSRTRTALDQLMSRFEPEDGGKLILWYGAPGTGKTSAIRSLAWEWRAWCGADYITDPETFLGRDAHYMMEVLLKEDDEAKERWRLIVLEDTGELLGPDARAQAGQGLSRLLNVVDGLIGQGLRILVLLTTNEDIGRLHPAVSRAGRCAFRHEFDRLHTDEARAWLARNDVRASVDGPRTLAELYAMKRGAVIADDRQTLGFWSDTRSDAAGSA
jgi:hypothetical protein